jgi:hypothetical protein
VVLGPGHDAKEGVAVPSSRSLEARTLRIFWKVRLPWALPHSFSALKVGILAEENPLLQRAVSQLGERDSPEAAVLER